MVSPEPVIEEPVPVTKRPWAPLPFEVTVVPVMVTVDPPVAAIPMAPLAVVDVVTEPPVMIEVAPLSISTPFAVPPPNTALPDVLTATLVASISDEAPVA